MASALVTFKYSTHAREIQQTLGREKARLLFLEEGARERNEKKTAQAAARTETFPLICKHLVGLT